MAAIKLGVPMVILKKQQSKILNGEVYQTKVTSFTKGTSYELTLSKKYIDKDDKILLIDDFLANGEAAQGGVRLIEEAGATIEGIGTVSYTHLLLIFIIINYNYYLVTNIAI